MAEQQAAYHGLRGKFIVFDGPDGCGKTTVRDRVAEHLRSAGLPVTTCKDPGGTPAGDRIRAVLLDHDLSDMSIQCETLLFMASRAQLVRQVIRPALEQEHVVLCDRFISATCAYQVAAGDDLATILELARYAVGTTWPDLTIVLDVPVEIGFARIGRRNHIKSGQQTAKSGPPTGLDAMERRPATFHAAVRANFLALPSRYPAPVEIISATEPLDAIVRDTLEILHHLGQGR